MTSYYNRPNEIKQNKKALGLGSNEIEQIEPKQPWQQNKDYQHTYPKLHLMHDKRY